MTKITMIGAGSTVFMKNLIGDALSKPALREAHIALMDIDAQRLAQSELVARKLVMSLGASASVTTHTNQREALERADFVIVAFQIGGFEPATRIDFDIPNRYGLRQTIADTLGIGGIMRGLRTVPHLWSIADDMAAVCPDALMLQYVNPMAINTWALTSRYPRLKQVGLCHSVQNTVEELALDLEMDEASLRYRVGGINHVAFLLELTDRDGNDLYPAMRAGYRAGKIPLESRWNPRCPNLVRYETFMHLGYFGTESSEHFAEYVPWFIKSHRPDLIERFRIPLDEYPTRCAEQVSAWERQYRDLQQAERIEHTVSNEYAATIMDSIVTGTPSVVYGNVANTGLIPQLPTGAAVEVPCLVDTNGLQPTVVDDIPPHLLAVMNTSVNVQQLTVEALLTENVEHIYHAAYMDPRTAAELDLSQIKSLVDDLLVAHGDWLPGWARRSRAA
ncbi:alpha-glucosidase/alpha-galactosidase [uncultured Roseobacter sp.]|uniref:alpha-glucosidase/alpha-galactosidase n=1 Tax=uncultured Roseobacter sp. TaxID=114847 RepID=UPI00261BA1D3|nr:alpha-glucosidase/alpha-galactosidase [uncultured Roseobacter sp.]